MPDAVIVGAGVGGLAAGLALARAGWGVEVLERAPAIAEVGAGLQISPNGWRALAALGVAEAVEAAAFEPRMIEMREGRGPRAGRRVVSIPMGQAARARWGAPYLQVHRADLIEALRRALEDVAPGAILTGAEVAGLASIEPPVLRLTSGERIAADLILGADGVRSTLRAVLFGAEEPEFTGAVAWRLMAPAAVLSAPPAPGAVVWAGPGRHAVAYPLRGGDLVNVVAIVEEDEWAAEGWSEPGCRDQLAMLFEGWDPALRDMIEKGGEVLRWGLFTRPPMPRWSKGGVGLLGDACHPMLPSLAQGACQALEDAVALAARLAEGGEIEAALIAHHRARIKRVSRVQRGAAANLRAFHKEGALAFAPIRAVATLAPAFFHRRLDWLYRGGPV